MRIVGWKMGVLLETNINGMILFLIRYIYVLLDSIIYIVVYVYKINKNHFR